MQWHLSVSIECMSKISNVAKICVEPLWIGEIKVCLQQLGHMTKITATGGGGVLFRPCKGLISGSFL